MAIEEFIKTSQYWEQAHWPYHKSQQFGKTQRVKARFSHYRFIVDSKSTFKDGENFHRWVWVIEIVLILKNFNVVNHQKGWSLIFQSDYFKISLIRYSLKCDCFWRKAEIKPKKKKANASRGHTFSVSLYGRWALPKVVWSWVNNLSTISSTTNNASASKGQIKRVIITRDPKVKKNPGEEIKNCN